MSSSAFQSQLHDSIPPAHQAHLSNFDHPLQHLVQQQQQHHISKQPSAMSSSSSTRANPLYSSFATQAISSPAVPSAARRPDDIAIPLRAPSFSASATPVSAPAPVSVSVQAPRASTSSLGAATNIAAGVKRARNTVEDEMDASHEMGQDLPDTDDFSALVGAHSNGNGEGGRSVTPTSTQPLGSPGALIDGEEKGGNGRGLKQTKRAAQNRAAQQAFRKRKDERAKELEDKEKLLAKYISREEELLRREKEVVDAERKLGINVNDSSASTSALGESNQEPQPEVPDLNFDVEEALQQAIGGGRQLQQQQQEITSDKIDPALQAHDAAQLQQKQEREKDYHQQKQQQQSNGSASSAPTENKSTEQYRLEIVDVKRQSAADKSLINSLRRSLEDLGSENRSLRAVVKAHGLKTAGDDKSS